MRHGHSQCAVLSHDESTHSTDTQAHGEKTPSGNAGL